MANFSQYYFAWCGPYEGFSGGHMREDELIFGFTLKHEEGQFCELELEIANPYMGLLAPGRPLWAWFSWNDGSNVYPLFYGRLVGIPDDLFGDAIKVKLIAKPIDYAAQRAAVAASLKVLPFYDPVFVDESKEDDPDVALEGYSALWHVDRFAGSVTISDIIGGEDGVIEFTQNEVFYDQVKMRLSGAPLLACEIEAEVEWTQCDHTGTFEMKTVRDLEGDPKIGGGITVKSGVKPPKAPFDPGQAPKPPQIKTYSWEYKNISPGPHEDGDLMEEAFSTTAPWSGGELVTQSTSQTNADPDSGQGEEYSIKESYKHTNYYTPPEAPDDEDQQEEPPPSPEQAQKNAKRANAEIAVEVEQDRKEAIYVAMLADVQPVLASLTEDQEDLIQSLSMNGRDVVAVGAASASDGVYFSTARGQQSVEYLLMVARAHLLAGSRVVEVEWECPFPKIVYSGMSCRKNATIDDPRLPGSVVMGKVVGYEMTGKGDDGEFLGKVTINCAVGNGTPVLMAARGATIDGRLVTNEGTPVYVEVGYVEVGYQYYAGRMVSATTGDTSFEELAFEAIGLQLPITEDQILVRHEYHDAGFGTSVTTATTSNAAGEALRSGAAEMRTFHYEPFGEPLTYPPGSILAFTQLDERVDNAISQAVVENPSWVEMEFKPVQKIRTEVNYQAAVGPLQIPKQINLAGS